LYFFEELQVQSFIRHFSEQRRHDLKENTWDFNFSWRWLQT